MGCSGNQTRPVEQTVNDVVLTYGRAEMLLFLVSAVVATLFSALDDDPNHTECDGGFEESEKCCNVSIYRKKL